MLRVLIASNGRRVKSGYGNQVDLFAPRLHRQAWLDIGIFAYCGQEGCVDIDMDGIHTFPRLYDPFGNDIVDFHAEFFHADVVFGLFDPHVIDPEVYNRFRWAHWTPIDSVPALPDNVRRLVQGNCQWVLSMSQFGHEQLQEAGFDPIYVPHGIDSQLFTPINRDKARARLGVSLRADLTGKFIVTMNAANKGMPSRKGFYEAFKAFKTISDRYENAVLYVHSDLIGLEGEHLPQHVDALEIDPDKVLYAPLYQYRSGLLSGRYLNDVYNAGDVFLTTSHGEGFGIPIAEAQMAGSPVIVTDFSAMSELCMTGWKVPGTPFCPWTGVEQVIPDVDKVIEALDTAYHLRENESIRHEAREKALAYDVDRVFSTYMLPAFERIHEDLQREKVRQKTFTIPARHALPQEPDYDVTVIIPAYKCKDTIEQAVLSALTQANVRVEVIAIDASSPDGVGELLDKMAGLFLNLRVVHKPECGYADDMNTALVMAKGRYIIPVEGDDWLEPYSLAQLAKVLDDNPRVGFVYGDVRYHIRKEEMAIPLEFNRQAIFDYNAFLYPVMFRKSLQVGWWQASAGIGANDWEHNISLAKAADGVKINCTVLHYRYQHGTQNEQMQARSVEIMNELRARHPEVTRERIP